MRRALLTALLSLGLTVLTLSPGHAVSVGTSAGVHPEWGSTTEDDASIKEGCRSYSYGYALTPPDGYWMLETFLVGPGGKQYGASSFMTGDPLAATSTWRLCRRSTPGGRFTLRAKLSVINGGDYDEGWLPDTTFRLRKPRR